MAFNPNEYTIAQKLKGSELAKAICFTMGWTVIIHAINARVPHEQQYLFHLAQIEQGREVKTLNPNKGEGIIPFIKRMGWYDMYLDGKIHIA